jgi:ribosomal protein L16 Arg81 hydroxylase
MSTFEQFLAPMDCGEFRRNYFGVRPVHMRRSLAPRPDILNWDRFNRALAVGSYWTEHSLKLYFKSRAALKENYCDPAEPGGRSAPVNPAKVRALISLGASLVANHIHRVCPEVADVVHMLESEFACRAFANVYCSFANVQAFQTHYDLHDVFAFQAEGEKIWRVFEAREDSPINPLPPGDAAEKWLIESRGALLFEIFMKPGDVLYLPRGQYHEALTASSSSLHVTFGVVPAMGLAVFDVLKNIASGDRDFRAYLPDARDGAALDERLAILAAKVQTIMSAPAFGIDLLNHQLSQANALAAYDLPHQAPERWYAAEGDVRIVRRQDGYWASRGGKECPLGSVSPAIEWLFSQRRCSLGELASRAPGRDASELTTVLEGLLNAGIVVEVVMR